MAGYGELKPVLSNKYGHRIMYTGQMPIHHPWPKRLFLDPLDMPCLCMCHPITIPPKGWFIEPLDYVNYHPNWVVLVLSVGDASFAPSR